MARLPRLLALCAVLAASLLVASTWHVFSQTWDEPAHVAAGMEWLERGTFETEELTPPLARVAGAFGPYVAGVRSHGFDDFWKEGNAILEDGGHYRRNLMLARAGMLPFLLIGAWAVWSWSRRLAGPWAGAAALALFLTLPVVLGHAGLAATDFPLCATVALALDAFTRWLAAPTRRAAAWLGVAGALAVLAKFSAIPFLACAFVAIAVLRWLLPGPSGPIAPRAMARGLVPLALTAAFTLWAGYHFAIDPLVDRTRESESVMVSAGVKGPILRLLELDIWPGKSLFKGLRAVPLRNDESHKTFFEGEAYRGARLAYFPVAFAIRTPLPFLALLLVAPIVLLSDRERRRRWDWWAPLAGGLAVLFVVMMSQLNLGLRLMLPAYACFAVVVGTTCVLLWRRGPLVRALVTLAIAAQMVVLARAHPDFVAYFNVLAGSSPQKHMVDSELDWGQDLFRLADTLKARGIDSLSIAYAGSADLDAVTLPPYHELAPGERVTGWVAISAYALKLGRPKDPPARAGEYRWLEAYTPVSRVGRSIFLYRIPPAAH